MWLVVAPLIISCLLLASICSKLETIIELLKKEKTIKVVEKGQAK